MKTFLEQVEATIEIDKEIIEVMPRKGIKKQRELLTKIEEMQEKYNKLKDALIREMNIRVKRLNRVKENPEIKEIEEKVKKLDGVENINMQKTSYEKMQLDRLAYDINGYYKKDLVSTNKDIYECIQSFKKVGINITAADFDISEYVKEYISAVLPEMKKGSFDSPVVKEKFDEVYWKSSDLIYHILMNIRYLYDKYEAEINKFYEAKMKSLTSRTSEDVRLERIGYLEKIDELKNVDARNILDRFYSKNYEIGGCTKNLYDAFYIKILGKTKEEIDEKVATEVDENIKILNRNAYEYFKFLEYKFIYDEALKIKKDADKIKEKEEEEKKEKSKEKNKKGKKKELTEYESTAQSIKTLTKEIYKINAELTDSKKSVFGKAKILNDKDKGSKIVERDKKILELKELYNKLDVLNFKKSIENNIDETSKIYDVLRIASYDYSFLAKCLIKRNNEITNQEIMEEVAKYRLFIKNFNFSVINNININENKPISIIIKDKFKILGFNLVKDDFVDTSLEDLITQTGNVDIMNNIEKSTITIKDIDFILKIKNLLKI